MKQEIHIFISFAFFLNLLQFPVSQESNLFLFCLALEMDCENPQERHWTAHGWLEGVCGRCVCTDYGGMRASSLRE